MSRWITPLASGLAVLAAGIWLRWRHRPWKGADSEGNRPDPVWTDLPMVGRLTGKFPALSKAFPDPAPKGDRKASALQGNLAQTPLHDLLQYLALGRKSGILELACGRRMGRIILKDGRVYKDSYRGKDGLEAMFMMLELAEGDFEFYEQTLEDSVTYSGLEVVDIIMLWMDRKPKKKA